jgi:hypothetical protein
MSVLRNLEQRLAGLVEGTFGRVFRTQVSPEELARRLARELDEHRVVSLSRTYAPHEFVVHLSPEDRERFAGIEAQVADELAAHLLEHARAERLVLTATPRIAFRTDERLGLGEFGIETRPVEPAAEPEPEPARPSVPAPPRRERAPAPPAPVTRAVLAAEGKRFAVGPAGATVGRSRECEVVLGDANVSRRHARLALGADGRWTVEDLGSTNGVHVNGARIAPGTPAPLQPGDRLDIGTVSARFEAG